MVASSILTVSRSGQGHFNNLSEAVINAQTGDTILVRPGNYSEYIVLDKPVRIIGDGPREDIIISSAETNCIVMLTDFAHVSNLTLRGASGALSRGKFTINVPQGKLEVANCDITSDTLACIAIHGSKANPAIVGCRIFGGKDSGVFVFNHGRGLLEDCEISGHDQHGVMITQCGNPHLRRCIVTRNRLSGIFAAPNARGLVEECDLTGNGGGAWQIEPGSQIQRHGNVE